MRVLSFTALLFSLALSSTSFAGISDGLVGYWNLDNCDVSGTGGNGTIKGNPTCVSGVAGKALQFANSNTTGYFDTKDWVVLPNFTATSFTVSLWAKYVPTKNYDPSSMVWSTGDMSVAGAAIYVDSDTGEAWGYVVKTAGADVSTSKKNINDNKFHMLTISADSTSLKFYVDSQLVGSSAIGQALGFSSLPQYLAYSQWYNGGAGSSRFNGIIDDVRVYNRVLSDAEIQQLYSDSSTPTTTCDSTTTYSQGYSAAQAACKANPSSCGITVSSSGVTTSGHATYTPSSNLVHIPYLDVPTLFGGTPTVYEIDLTVMPNTDPLQLKLQNAKQVQ